MTIQSKFEKFEDAKLKVSDQKKLKGGGGVNEDNFGEKYT